MLARQLRQIRHGRPARDGNSFPRRVGWPVSGAGVVGRHWVFAGLACGKNLRRVAGCHERKKAISGTLDWAGWVAPRFVPSSIVAHSVRAVACKGLGSNV